MITSVLRCPHLDNMAEDAEIWWTPGEPDFPSPFSLLHQWGKAKQLGVLLQYLAVKDWITFINNQPVGEIGLVCK